jgi:CheY-like chemotaxis protein
MQPRILFVYSDRALASTMEQAFVSLGAQLVAISETGKASQLIEDETFDAVLLDGPSLGRAGLILEERLHHSARNHNTEVIVLSDYHHDILRAKLKQGDATFVLDQPFIAEQLRGLLCAGRVNVPPVQRKFVRVPFQAHVLCDTQHEEFTALAETLCEGGIGLLVCGDVTMYTEWVVCFTLPNSTEILEAKGRVRRTSETQVGLSFSSIHDCDRVKIQEYVSHHKALVTT